MLTSSSTFTQDRLNRPSVAGRYTLRVKSPIGQRVRTSLARHGWSLTIILTIGVTACWKLLPADVVEHHLHILLALLAIAAC